MGQTAVPDDRRMTDAEGLMWRLEADPTFASGFASITILDRPADPERLRQRMARTIALVPRLRQRVQERPFGLPPIWVDVPYLDLEHHVRVVTLPAPGDMHQVQDFATDLLAQPFDRSRPLWQFVLIDGLADGQGALVQKMHHTVSDGENGLRLSMQFVDLERDAPEPPPLTEAELDAAEPQPPPSAADALVEAMGVGLRLGTTVVREMSGVLLSPSRFAEVGASVGERIRGTVTTLTDTEPAQSTLWGARSLERRLETLQVPLEPVRAAAHVLGGTLNVAFLTASAAAAGRYHAELGAPVDTLRASMAISTRRQDASSNSFTLGRLRVPTGEMEVAERFEAIQAAADAVRDSAQSAASLASLAGLAATLPTPVIVRLARQQVGTVDFATSNLKAAPFPLYVAGARILATYPVGPLVGVAFNLTLLSYCGNLDMGLHLDPAAVTEPARLRALLADSFDELIDVGARVPARSAPSKARPSSDKRAKPTKATKSTKSTQSSQAKKATKSAAKRAPSSGTPKGRAASEAG